MSTKRETLSVLFALVLALGYLLVLMPTPAHAAARTASVTGNWDSTTTWEGSAVPTSVDTVTVNNGITVTVNVANALCSTLTLNQGTNGTATLSFNSGSKLTIGTTLTVGGTTNKLGSINMDCTPMGGQIGLGGSG
jgi:hypothetical protein